MEDVIEVGNTGIAQDNELEQRYIRYKDVIKELTIMNDIFMRNVLKKQECVEYILRTIMEMKDLQIFRSWIILSRKTTKIYREDLQSLTVWQGTIRTKDIM